MASFVPSVSAIYSASVEDSATIVYFLLFQVMGVSPNLKIYPVLDFLSYESPA